MLARYMREKAERPVRYAVDPLAARNYLGLRAAAGHYLGGSKAARWRQNNATVEQALPTPLHLELLRQFLDDPQYDTLGALNDLISESTGRDAREVTRGTALQVLFDALHRIVNAGSDAGPLPQYTPQALRAPGLLAAVNLPRRRAGGRSLTEHLQAAAGMHPQIALGADLLADNDLAGIIPASIGLAESGGYHQYAGPEDDASVGMKLANIARDVRGYAGE